MQTKTLIVPLSNNRSYPIYIGENLLQNPDIFADFVTNKNKSKNKKIMIVTNTTIEKIYFFDYINFVDSPPNFLYFLIMVVACQSSNVEPKY